MNTFFCVRLDNETNHLLHELARASSQSRGKIVRLLIHKAANQYGLQASDALEDKLLSITEVATMLSATDERVVLESEIYQLVDERKLTLYRFGGTDCFRRNDVLMHIIASDVAKNGL